LSPSATTQTREVNTFAAFFAGSLIAGKQTTLIIEDERAFLDYHPADDTLLDPPFDPNTEDPLDFPARITATLDSTTSDPVTVLLTSDGTNKFTAVVQLTDVPAATVDTDENGLCPELYILNDLVTPFVCELDTDVQFLDVEIEGDNVILSYRGFDKAFSASEYGNNPAAFGGDATDPNDPVRFKESDAYYEGSTATLRIRDANFVGDTITPVTVTSSNGNTFDLTATRVVGSTDLFETGGVTIVADNPDGASTVIVSPAGTTLSATYNSFEAIANVISSPTVQRLFDVDTTAVETCTAGDSDNGADTDNDGLCDFWEHPSPNVALKIPTSVAGEYYELSCDDNATLATDPTGATVCPTVGVPDLYIEYDYMIGHVPSSTAITDFVSAMDGGFVRDSGGAVVGIDTHFFVDNEIQHVDALLFSSSDTADTTFLTLKNANFGTNSERDLTPCIDAGTSEVDCESEVERLLTAKRQVFRYGMSIHDQATLNSGNVVGISSSGYAERPGNDFIVSLGSFTAYQGSIGQQSGTLMHEVGHTLGLQHGGTDDIQCKPNYPSVMNYLYQFSEEDGGELANRPLDYSRSVYTTIDEASLTNGMKIIGSTTRTMVIGGVDSNDSPLTPFEEDAGTPDQRSRRGTVAGTAEPITWAADTKNIRHFTGIAGCDATDQFGLSSDSSFTGLRSQDDWGAINFNFRNTNGFASGIINIIGSDVNEEDNSSGIPSDNSGVHDLDAGVDVTITENEPYVPVIFITDPHQEQWSATFDYGDNTSVTVSDFEYGVDIPEIDHLYDDAGVYTVTVTINNGFDDVTDTLTVTVTNVLPEFDSLGDVTGFETLPITHTGGSISFASVDAPPTLSLTADFGDGTIVDVPLIVDGTSATFTLEHVYDNADANTPITLTANDQDGELVTAEIIPSIEPVYDDVIFTDPLSNKPYQEGRTIPVKFTVVEDGLSITNLNPEILVQFGSDVPFSVGFATFDVAGQQYSLQLDTDGYPTSGTVNIIAKLPDFPVVEYTHQTTIKLKSGSK
jgi:hypothetical protein